MDKLVALVHWLGGGGIRCTFIHVSGLPEQPILRKLSSGHRFDYTQHADGSLHLVDLWQTLSDVADTARFNPDAQNVYHLFTRKNPRISQVLVPGLDALLLNSNFNATQRTAILVHGWGDTVTGNYYAVMVPAFLAAADMNVIAVDWSVGASAWYTIAMRNAIASGESIARVITWINNATGADLVHYHIAGHSLGGQQIGVIGRNLGGKVGYISRRTPESSQVLVPGHEALLFNSNFNATKRTAVLVHGWGESVTGNTFAVLVPAFLAAADMNVIAVDWSVGALAWYPIAVRNAIASGESVARVITWINSVTGADLAQYHIVGYSLGGQQVGVLGRNLGGKAGYISSLDLAGTGWEGTEHMFRSSDGVYTEVIHTSRMGYPDPCADVDFYPNGGRSMPGCITATCDHERAYYYLAESLVTGGFTGTRCEDRPAAQAGNCTLPETLPMGGLTPKTGESGVYYLETNSAPPFSQG